MGCHFNGMYASEHKQSDGEYLIEFQRWPTVFIKAPNGTAEAHGSCLESDVRPTDLNY